ncbi:MAG: beta-ketoacyl-ACP synthase 3 [Bacteroidetes bacterium]|jgi:3-oxoacyl-[acyl-carrier-protein] synthase-3|nr:beta-ketoacyl-ACP synthase 3 [Bacteroidota bacterium]
MGAFIRAISYNLPVCTFTNEDFFLQFPDSRINSVNLSKIGVKQRHIALEGELASDLAVKSAERLFVEHNVNPAEIDFLLFCAQEFDYFTPSTACTIQHRLKLPSHCGALDFNLGCSGFVYGLSLAKGLIESVGLKNILLLTSSTLTRKLHPKDASLRYLFGDAACATLISNASEVDGEIGQFVFGTDGAGAEKIIVKDGGARNLITNESYTEISNEYGNITSKAYMDMKGPAVFSFSIKIVPKIIADTLEKNQMHIKDIDLFIFHQANLFIIDTIRKKLNLSENKVFNYMETVGNTVSSSIPIALYEAMKQDKAKKGDSVVLVGFGVGLSWAATIIKL